MSLKAEQKPRSKMSDEAPSKELELSVPDYITDDIIYQILLHLPVDSLLRFKSVCKCWFALISSPNFVTSQFATTISTAAASDDQLHIGHCYDRDDETNTSILLVDVACRRIVAHLDPPFSPDEFPYLSFYELVGSACGIVCVSCTIDNLSYIYLWNPATKLSKRIPLHNIRDHGEVVLGFGFDRIGNDFKVVRVVSPTFSAEVYSASRNAWRNVEPNPTDFPIDNNFDVCFNGFLCTAGRYGMIAFDLNAGVFNCLIKFPAPTFDESITEFDGFDPHARITEYNGSIAAIICRRSDYDRKINLWSLDDAACLSGGGIQASWTLRLNIIVDQPVQFVHGYFRGDDFLLLNDDVWYLYNSNNKEADLCIPENEKARIFMDAFYCGQIFRYTKSLFKIDGFTQVNQNAQENESEDDDSEEDSEDDMEDDVDLVMHFFKNIP